MNCFTERVIPSRFILDVAPFSTMMNANAYISGYVLSGYSASNVLISRMIL